MAAWRELRGGAGLVGVQERRADGVVEPTQLSAPRGGAVGRMAMGGSGLGDAIVAWAQGGGANAQIAAAVIDAPPDPFLVLLPSGWQRKRRIRIAWDHSPNAIGRVRYSVSVDDEPVIENRKRPPRLPQARRHRQTAATGSRSSPSTTSGRRRAAAPVACWSTGGRRG